MSEVLFWILFLSIMLGSWLILKPKARWLWFGTFVAIALCVVFGEIVSKITTGVTLSQNFWVWSIQHPYRAWFVILMQMVGWSMLMVHLAWKMLTRKKE